MRIKKGTWLILAVLFMVGAYFGKTEFWDKRTRDVGESQTITKGDAAIPDAPNPSLTGDAAIKLALPTTDVASPAKSVPFTINEMGWNSQMSLNLAVGGPRTTVGSLAEQCGFDITIARQDNPSISATDLVNKIKAYKDNPAVGGLGFIVMGSGVPMYYKTVYDKVKELGEEYTPYLPTVVMSSGRSAGEDQVIGDIKYKQTPQLLRGKVIRGVKLDGDLDLALKFCADNGVPVNVNPETYDRNALNFSYSTDFLSCVNEYNNFTKETRKIVKNGKTTGTDTTLSYDLCATWTPGDVNVSTGSRGGATIINTKTYSSIMPNMMITSRKFVVDNPDAFVKLTAACATAADQIRTFESTKRYGAKLNAQIFNESDEDEEEEDLEDGSEPRG